MKSRREFFQWALVLAGSVGTSKFSRLLAADSAAAGALKEVSPSDATAKQLGYTPDAAKVDTKKYPQKKTPEGKTQLCNNCMFFTPEKDNPSLGKCQVIQSGLVRGKGWCMSWAKRP